MSAPGAAGGEVGRGAARPRGGRAGAAGPGRRGRGGGRAAVIPCRLRSRSAGDVYSWPGFVRAGPGLGCGPGGGGALLTALRWEPEGRRAARLGAADRENKYIS